MYISEKCSKRIDDMVKHITSKCINSYNIEQRDQRNYNLKWESYNATDEQQTDTAFKYNSQGDTFWGYLDTYGGDGYVILTGPNLQTTKRRFEKLKTNNWLDERTRALFVEFSVFNMNTGLVTTITIAFELPTQGGIFIWKEYETMELYRYTGKYI